MQEKAFSKADALDFFGGYVACALWSSVDEHGEPLDETYGIEHISAETLHVMREDCDRFLRENAADLCEMMAITSASMENLGWAFWLTRNGHGAGFWAREAADVGERLTEAAYAFGAVDLYVGDDGKVHA